MKLLACCGIDKKIPVVKEEPFCLFVEKYVPTVMELGWKNIKVLSDKLNVQCFDVYKWEQLWRSLCDKKLVKCSGGLMECLKNPGACKIGEYIIENLLVIDPECSVDKLYRLAKKYERNDICLILHEFRDTLVIAELDHCTNLELSALFVKDFRKDGWKFIADDLGFDEEQIERIVGSYNSLQYRSSAEKMFKVMKTRYPTFELTHLYNCLSELKINDVADSLQTIILEKTGFDLKKP